MIVTKRNSLRLAAVGAMGAVTLALAGTTAMAATPAAHQAAVTAARASLTAKPSVTSVNAWQQFRVTGTATGLKAGSKVTLQQVQHGKWVTLPASTTVTRSGAYSLRVELGLKGKNQLRMVSGSTASAVFNVTVR
ncbi:hypothetical protein K7472_26250 [Streptomyces sp. PTM05]|uniref:Uncharacterized protein n=1 Tax=Streptantibioticus parmotrematis TaxID=2873249 RepID=A0ABS7R2Q5_9ACTN|nr:hypothetical protein [Streptantibioticus parmotrematis]MBY8888314.1 hypothetical protein [Streptantibioticus parmotrematis]